MKKLINYTLIILTQVLILSSCKVYEDVYNLDQLYGTWICSKVDDRTLSTDESFVFKFNNDRTGLYALGIKVAGAEPKWIENTNIIYALRGTVLVMTFRTSNGVEQVMELNIESLTATELTYRVSLYKIDGVDKSDTKLYRLVKSDADLKPQLVGYWQGRLTGQPNDFIWHFKSDGTYNFYEYDVVNKKYLFANENTSSYRLYGNLLVCIYSNDLTTGISGNTFDCWAATLPTANTMTWKDVKTDGTSVSENLVRIPALPPVGD